MTIQGSAERLLDSVLPHEITHMIFASHFRRPLPRWADEGGATSVEHASERAKHHKMLVQFLQSNRGIAFNRMFAMKEYPRDIMPLYAQGYSLAEFLIQQGGRAEVLDFLGDGMETTSGRPRPRGTTATRAWAPCKTPGWPGSKTGSPGSSRPPVDRLTPRARALGRQPTASPPRAEPDLPDGGTRSDHPGLGPPRAAPRTAAARSGGQCGCRVARERGRRGPIDAERDAGFRLEGPRRNQPACDAGGCRP